MGSVKSESRRILVIGGGIVGSATALALLGRGHAVTLVDEEGPRRRASWGNAGHIAIEQVEPLASLATVMGVPRQLLARDGALALPWREAGRWLPFVARLAWAARPSAFARGQAALSGLLARAMPAWQRYVEALGAPALLRRTGHIIVWDRPESAARGRQAWQADVPEGIRFRDLTADEEAQIAALRGGKAPAGALYCEGSGSIAGHDLLEAALRARFAALGGRWLQGRARLWAEGATVLAALADGTPLLADEIIVAGGVLSRPLLEGLGFAVPMIAERGYHLQAPGARWPADLPPVVFEDRAMIVTRFEDSVRASSFVELARPGAPADPAKWAALRRRISELGLPFELPGAEWLGARPTLPDYLPAIGRSRHHTNLLYAFGHQHLGLTLGPLSGEIIADLVEGRAPPVSLAPFDIERFGARRGAST